MTSKNANDLNWWRQAVVYQIYPRSFADANGDGIGDLQGIISKIPYLKALGVDAIWLSPFYPSALKDGGYDVADYRNVDPRIGTLEDFDQMSKALKEAGIKVIVDIVPNHSSDDHPWFQEALKAKPGSVERDRFIFRDGAGPNKDEPPSDWQGFFGGSAWTPSGQNDGQFYLHLFDESQPDWNWDNQEVIDDFLKTLRFWGDRGVSGFRVDVACFVCKDMSEPYMTTTEHQKLQGELMNRGANREQEHPFFDRDATLEIYKGWRKVFNEYDPPLTAVGEIFVAPDRKPLYSSVETLGQAFSFDIMNQNFSASEFKQCIEGQIKELSETQSSTTWVLSNHDVIRHRTRYGNPTFDDGGMGAFNGGWHPHHGQHAKDGNSDLEVGLRRGKAAITLLLALPGSTYMYQGEELGLPEVVDIPDSLRQDPWFINGKSPMGRDGCRVPLPWTKNGPSCGFGPTEKTWLPQPKGWGELSAEAQEGKQDSTLELYRKALKLRHGLQTAEKMEWVDESNPDVLHFRRPGGWEVITNFGKEAIKLPQGEVLLSSQPVDANIPGETTVWLKTGA